MKSRTRLGIGLAVVLAAAGAVVAARASSADGDDPLADTIEVVRGTVVDQALAVGRVEPEVEVIVKSQLSGVVARLHADAGDFVRAGEPLIEIRPNPTPLELVDARRQVELRTIERNAAEREIERQRTLLDRGLVSRQDFDAVERRFAEAALQVRMAAERLSLLEDGRARAEDQVETVVRAPITGYVLEKSVQLGDPVVPLTSYQEGTVLMRMSEMRHLLFRGTVDEIDVGRLREGMPALLKVGALPETPVPGRLARISLKARQEESATVFPVEIALTAPPGVTLRAGYSASAEVVIARRDSVPVIPERVVTFEGDSAWVTVQLGPDATERRRIVAGLSDAIQLEVVEGLAVGERVREKPVREIR